jgi:hypothetical protein
LLFGILAALIVMMVVGDMTGVVARVCSMKKSQTLEGEGGHAMSLSNEPGGGLDGVGVDGHSSGGFICCRIGLNSPAISSIESISSCSIVSAIAFDITGLVRSRSIKPSIILSSPILL